ncbi:uncharacterized protein LOC123537928 [Mercenaria mercenaria]|uniref:uncharacterized protein LOC123537928 n=1 Tax=Mercenaria mercenaria TaxID=6596 RepID=UPI00234F8354|nr:uncharacterized protein LOC123537928 [Mercenaria mercenaria]
MKVRKTALSIIFCLPILVLAILYIDVRIQPQRSNTHLHIYYSFVTNTSSTDDYADSVGHSSIRFINIFNQTSVEHDRTTLLHVNVTKQVHLQATMATRTPASRAHIIAIVSYMRSGSTLTADIMQHFPGAMYVFEPFHSLVIRARSKRPLYYLNGTVKRLNAENITDDLLRSELRKWFECRFGELDAHSLTDSFHTQYSRSMKTFNNCWRRKRRTLKTLRECLPAAIEMCKRAKYRLFKFIRLPMRIVQSVMDMYPGLQAVHLIRDPRGSLLSQFKIRNITWDRIGNLSERFCNRVADDISSTIFLNRHYQERAKMLLYEKLAENPLTTAEKLHSFTNLPHYKYVTRYITKLTMGGHKNYGQFGSLRENSTKAAYRWRDTINFEHVQTIDENCANVYDFIGYQKFSSAEDVRDHNLLTLQSPKSSIFL